MSVVNWTEVLYAEKRATSDATLATVPIYELRISKKIEFHFRNHNIHSNADEMHTLLYRPLSDICSALSLWVILFSEPCDVHQLRKGFLQEHAGRTPVYAMQQNSTADSTRWRSLIQGMSGQ